MKTLHISLKEQIRSYPIHIGDTILNQLFSNLDSYSKIMLITDANLKEQVETLKKQLPSETEYLILPPGEKEKTIETVQKIWSKMLEKKLDRKSLVINLGGGVICDMGGFAASTYMRGIDFINIPSTLLSQVDASVGGKTAIDFGNVKNLVGTFTQPKAVIIDVALLKTLPKREFLSGFAEIMKHGLIKDKKYFELIISKDPFTFSQEELIEIIVGSCEIKSEVVQQDETEGNARKLLNFGHTIGHAVEALSLETSKPLLHGEAISIGMVAESEIAQKIGMLSQKEVEIIKTSLRTAGLPIHIPDFQTNQLLAKMKSDKKNSHGNISFTLLKTIGEAIYDQYVEADVILDVIRHSRAPHEMGSPLRENGNPENNN